jgi:prepilin-type N-terminal cleavage/methylation domain-containing protein
MKHRIWRKRLSSQAGMSLVEMLVAIVILAVGLLGLAELQVTAMRANSQSHVTVTATAMAQRVIEAVAARSPDDGIFDAGVTDIAWTWSPVSVEGVGRFLITYSVRRSVDPDDANPDGPGYMGIQDLCRIDVTVRTENKVAWGYGLSKQHAITMTTLKRSI